MNEKNRSLSSGALRTEEVLQDSIVKIEIVEDGEDLS